MNTLEVWIGEHYAPALINDDWTGLSDEDVDNLTRFLCVDVQDAVGTSYEEILNETDEFGMCEVTGLRGPVVKVHFHAVQTH